MHLCPCVPTSGALTVLHPCLHSAAPLSRLHSASCGATCVLIPFLVAAADVDIVVAPVFLHLTEVQKTLKAPFKVGCQGLPPYVQFASVLLLMCQS